MYGVMGPHIDQLLIILISHGIDPNNQNDVCVAWRDVKKEGYAFFSLPRLLKYFDYPKFQWELNN